MEVTDTGVVRSAPTHPVEPWATASLTLYRLFDVGYEIALEQASVLLVSSAPERKRPVRGEAHAIQIANPPVTVRLGAERLEIAGSAMEVEVSARLFDFGVVSLRARLSPLARTGWTDLAAWGASITGAPDWSVHFQRWRTQLLARMGPAIERPGQEHGISEDYAVFRIGHLEDRAGAPLPVEALSEEHVAALLFGEARPLSAAARRELLSQRYSYFEDDLVVLAWNAALVVEPVAEDTDVQYVLEFANAQLLELRYYDSVLDAEIPRTYDGIVTARRGWHLIGRRYSRLLGELQERVADATELVERVENSLKVTDDVFLARIYTSALEIFRGRTWRNGIDRKVAIVREAYNMLNDESLAGRAEVLELTVVGLIVLEIVLAVLLR